MEKLLRRALSVLVALLILIPGYLPAFATEADGADRARERILSAYSLEHQMSSPGTPTENGVAGERISLEDCNISSQELDEIFSELYLTGQLPWYAGATYVYTYNEETRQVYTYAPVYLDPQAYDRCLYEQTVAEILAEAVQEDMDQWQIALALHDYLVSNFRYDETLTNYRGYDLLVNGSAVCSGYAEVYQDLLSRVGIQSVIVESQEMPQGHGWNLVKLYGQWYHVDVTWDDPGPDIQGYVSHKYFLLTDREMAQEGTDGHDGWETEITCTDTTFENAFWHDTQSAILWKTPETCYLQTTDTESFVTQICARNSATGEYTLLYTEQPQYMDLGTGERYTYKEQGLSLYNGRLYGSDMNTVYSIAPDGSDFRTEFTYDTESNQKYIAGSFVKEGKLYLTLATHEQTFSAMEVTLEQADPIHTHSYTPEVFPPGCTEQGWTEYVCECGISFTENYTLPVGHTYDSGKTVLEPTYTQCGVVQFTCTQCGHQYTQQLAMLELPPVTVPKGLPAVFCIAGGAIVLLMIFLAVKRRR